VVINVVFVLGGVDFGYVGILGILVVCFFLDNYVFMIDNDGVDVGGLVVNLKLGINSVKDFEGKMIGIVIGIIVWMGLFEVMKVEGVDESKVKIENVGLVVWVFVFNKGDVDGIWGWVLLIF